MSENKATMGMIDSLSQNVQDMVTPQDFLELLYERAGMTLPQYFRCSDLPVKSVPSPLEDIRRAVKELAEIGNPPPRTGSSSATTRTIPRPPGPSSQGWSRGATTWPKRRKSRKATRRSSSSTTCPAEAAGYGESNTPR